MKATAAQAFHSSNAGAASLVTNFMDFVRRSLSKAARSGLGGLRRFAWRVEGSGLVAGIQLRIVLAVGLVVGCGEGGRAVASTMAAAPPNLVETGTPSFTVLGPEALGLSVPPTDLHELPNGAILVVARTELAIGDGVRWTTIRRHPSAEVAELSQVAVDRDGSIYVSVPRGFARLVLGEDAQWRTERVVTFPEPGGTGRGLSRLTTVGENWYWHSVSGMVIVWRPGQPVRVIGEMNNLESVLQAGGHLFMSDAASGALFRAGKDGLEPFDTGRPVSLDSAVTCSVPLTDGAALVGLGTAGVQSFDGREFRPLVQGGPLGGRHRVNDLCDLGGGLFGAALDNLGIAFFDSNGRIVQIIGRNVYHRLARVQRLVRGSGATVWALLGDGLACVEFPSRLSEFDAYVTTGLGFSRAYRYDGRLWLQADGRAQRGVYDEDGRLLRFDVDSPGGFVNALSTTTGVLLACAEGGLYRREGDKWRLEVPGIVKAHICPQPCDGGRWLYVAVNEVGLLQWQGGRLVAERFPVPDLREPYVGLQYGGGAYWAELGAGRVARITLREGRPVVRVFDRKDGLPNSWAQVFVVGGEALINLASKVFRYDRRAERFVELTAADSVLVGQIAENGRPERDARGRLWVAANDTVRLIAETSLVARQEPVLLPPGFSPMLFTMEDQGVVWLHQRQRLVRYDPAIPEAATPPLRAIIGHLQLTNSDRHSYFAGGQLAELEARDNSFAVQLLAPGGVFRRGVSFEVRLEGADGAWAPAGPAGVASFSRLKEGGYVLHVRPRLGAETGAEATLSFTIRPPWFRTRLAILCSGAIAVGVVLLFAWSWLLLTRREQVRLAHLVSERTAELRRSEDRYRRLNEELERRVDLRTADLHRANSLLRESNRELEAFSYTIAHDLRAPLRNISGFTELLRRRGAERLDGEGNRYLGIVLMEAGRLSHLIDSLLAFARIGRMELKRAWLDPRALVDAVVQELAPELENREVEWRINEMPPLFGDPTLIRQVYAHLLGNAVKFTRERPQAIIEVGAVAAHETDGETEYFVRDNGIGFDPKYATKLFGVFERLHTAKQYEGIGIGLANVRRIITHHGGRVWAEGVSGRGATVSFVVPQPVGTGELPSSSPS